MNFIKAFRTKSRIKLSGFISSFVLIFLLAWTTLPASAAGIEASREVSAETVYPGESFTVAVHIKADQNVEALMLDENLPGGWQVSQSENNGAAFQEISIFKASTLEWIWVENLSAGEEKTVVYNVTVPSNFEPGNFTISGTISGYSVPPAPVGGFSKVILAYPPPEVDFSANPLLGIAPLVIQFTDLSSSNLDSWEWDFDGNGNIESKEKNPVYTYENPGTYTVTLKATNNTYGNNTRIKTGYITVTEKPSISGGSGGSGGGGGAGSPESTRNIELKEISNEQVFKGTHTCFTFKGGKNEIMTVEFDPKKNFGKTTAIVEMLKNTSSIVKDPAPGTVYRNVNVWVGNSGISSPQNLENARINFRVKRTWVTEEEVSKDTVTLYRYSEGSWNPLPTALSREDEIYLYFTAETPGFSPFAISGTKKEIQSVDISPVRTGENLTLNEEKTSGEEKQEIPASNVEKEEKRSSPGLEAAFAAAELLVLYGVLNKKR
ncbi:PGF-pre-PGF domain-containing protein [Methanosarcina sp.]|uniref:PGF-pre-PGF domain-containing protein n=1 Tax=Methanosarcina sp. TaxID=2213 RepID=UPI003C725AA5